MRSGPSSSVAAAVALVAVLGLGGCISNPSAKAVAEDVVESFATENTITDTERDCMLEKLDGYTEDQLQEIGEANEQFNFSAPGSIEAQGTPALQEFVEDLNSCMADA